MVQKTVSDEGVKTLTNYGLTWHNVLDRMFVGRCWMLTGSHMFKPTKLHETLEFLVKRETTF